VDLTLERSESVLLVFQNEKRALPRRLTAGSKPVREPLVVVREAAPPELLIPSAPEAAAVSDSASRDEKALSGCAWIWGPDGNAAQVAAPGARYFRGRLTVAAGRTLRRARFIGTCDNFFTLYVNGKEAGKSRDTTSEGWRVPTEIDVTPLLREGVNVVAIAAVNGTDQPSPAGLIGKLELAYEQGEPQEAALDLSWKSLGSAQAGWNQPGYDDAAWPAAKRLGDYGCAPWHRFASAGKRPNAATVSPVVSAPFVGRFELPADVKLDKVRVFVEMDALAPEEAARVTVNGQDAGGFIGRPLRLEVTRQVKSGSNTMRIVPFAPQGVRVTFWPKQ